MIEVFAFACRHKDRPEWQETTYNAQTASKARYQYWLDITEPYPDVRLIDLKVRKLGRPRANQMFRHVARMRGMPDLEPGERITSKIGDGVIVDAGGGACFVVIFDTGEYAGKRLTLHPMEFERVSFVNPTPASELDAENTARAERRSREKAIPSNQCSYCGREGGKHTEVCVLADNQRLRVERDDALAILAIALPGPRPWPTESVPAKLRIYREMAVDLRRCAGETSVSRGCELDTDGDGNCPIHPKGCPPKP